MSFPPEDIRQSREDLLKINERYAEIARLLKLQDTLSPADINTFLQRVYESLLKTGIINEDGKVNEQEIFSAFSEGTYRQLSAQDILASYYSLEYDAELECGIVTWNGLIAMKEFQQVNENFLELARKHKLRKMIRDTRNFTILSPLSRKWFTDYMIPQFYEVGIKFSAVLIPQNQLSRKIVEDIIHTVNPGKMDVRLFSSMEEARSWIASV